tara:strand:+ start:90534 stop:90788 length:255 start_codon:yes stop_codon:yes gene_type:complete
VVTAPARGGRKIMEVNMATKTTKQDTVLKLLKRKQGATVEQLQKATGWQPHSVRAALTGLRKKGHDIRREKNAKDITVYKLANQ